MTTIQPIYKKCASCSTELRGEYCHHCGEKIIRKEDWEIKTFVRNTVEEALDWDSRVFKTLKYLLIRPGFLTKEFWDGKRSLYVKPFKIYITLLVIHFIVFAALPVGDIFDINHLFLFDLFPFLKSNFDSFIHQRQMNAEEILLLNEKIKDVLSILFYLVVFVIALCLKLVYRNKDNYYVEHLIFSFHLVAFGFLRNLVLIPLIIYNVGIGMGAGLFINLIYLIVAMKYAYNESWKATILKGIVLGGCALFILPSVLTLSILAAILL